MTTFNYCGYCWHSFCNCAMNLDLDIFSANLAIAGALSQACLLGYMRGLIVGFK